MNNKGKFIIVLFAVCLAFAFFFNGCGGNQKKQNNTEAVIVWHWMTDRHESFKKIAEKYKQDTGKIVKFELNAPSSLYTTKVRGAAQTKTLPDIFGVLGESKDMANFIKSNLIINLSSEMEKENSAWKNAFFSKSIGMNEFKSDNSWDVEPGIYGVPLDVMNLQMVYNKKIFAEAGITELPKTWDEFLSAGEKVLKTGKKFFVSGFGETWIINSMIRNFAFNIMGKETFLKTIKGEASYDTKDWVEVFSKFKELADKKLFASGVVTMINKQAERLFATEKAAVTYNGSWCVNVYQGMNKNLEYATLFYPSISQNFPVVIMGGAGSSFSVNSNSNKKQEAIDFLKWLTNTENQVFLSTETNNLPANKNAVGKMSEILDQFADDMENTFHPALLPASEDPQVEEKMARGIQSIIIGETTPQKLAKDLQTLKTRVSKENA